MTGSLGKVTPCQMCSLVGGMPSLEVLELISSELWFDVFEARMVLRNLKEVFFYFFLFISDGYKLSLGKLKVGGRIGWN